MIPSTCNLHDSNMFLFFAGIKLWTMLRVTGEQFLLGMDGTADQHERACAVDAQERRWCPDNAAIRLRRYQAFIQPQEFCSADFLLHCSPRPVARNPTMRLALLLRCVLLESLFNMSRLLQREWRSEMTQHATVL